MQTVTLLYGVERSIITWQDFLMPSILFITDTTDFSKKTDMMKIEIDNCSPLDLLNLQKTYQRLQTEKALAPFTEEAEKIGNPTAV